ncbi:hypothetical protein [Demequina aurantiaca]|uniref:hypothetical protein n=1 Tax=Demequina aurantiaca TaxID=676200 RepID=UPI003D3334E6
MVTSVGVGAGVCDGSVGGGEALTAAGFGDGAVALGFAPGDAEHEASAKAATTTPAARPIERKRDARGRVAVWSRPMLVVLSLLARSLLDGPFRC